LTAGAPQPVSREPGSLPRAEVPGFALPRAGPGMMSVMDDLTAFIGDRLDEDERVARAGLEYDLRDLAARWSDHADYQAEWAPA